MKQLIALIHLLLIAHLAIACGKVSGKDELAKESGTAGVANPNSPEGSTPGAPPAYVSHTRINPSLLEVTLTKELTSATATNTSNFIFNNGLQAVSVAKKAGEPATLQITTSTQQQINYNLTLLNLTTVESVNLTGVIQITFEGLPSPAITSVAWKDPTNSSNNLPASAYGISLCTLGSGSGSVCTSAPFYNHASLYGNLTPGNAVAYSYRIDAGSWSAEQPIATPLTVSGLADGFHTIYIRGRHTNGYWQAENASDVYTLSWVQDATAPQGVIDPLTQPAAVTASTTFNVRVIGSDVTYFIYCLDNATITDCNSATWQGLSAAPLASLGYGLPIGSYPSNLQPGAVTIRVRAIDASGNLQPSVASGGQYSWVVDTGTVEALFNTTDIAAITTTGTTVSVRVTNIGGAVAYKGKVVAGTDCNAGTGWDALPEITNLSTPITSSGLAANGGYYTICAIGKSLGNQWQGGWTGTATANVVTKYSWVVDTQAPTAAFTWLNDPYAKPTAPTTVTDYQWQVSTSDGVTHYRYAVVSGAGSPCSSATFGAETTVATPIVFSAATTGVNVYKLCVIARDAAGNYQAASAATTEGEWTVDKEPPANNPAFTSVSQSPRSFSVPVIEFAIDNGSAPNDAYFYKVEVSTSSGFGSLISSQTVESCKSETSANCPATLSTKTVTVTVDPYTQGSVYARIQAGDKAGNYRADYGTASAEHYVVGKITGTVRTTAGAAISGVSVRMLDSDGTSLAALYPDQSTNGAGQFTFSNVRTAKNRYRVAAAMSDATYRPAMKRGIAVREEGALGNTISNIGNMILVAQTATTPQTIVGKIIDAEDGWMLGYAQVRLVDWQGNTVGSPVRTVYASLGGITDCDTVTPAGDPPTNIPKMNSANGGICGDYTFTNVTPGTYAIEVTGVSWGTTNQTYNDLRQENIVVSDTGEQKYLVLRAGGSSASLVYDPMQHAFRNGPAIINSPNNGAHGFRIPTGVYANKYMLIDGDSTATQIYNPVDNGQFNGPALTQTANTGSFTIAINAGTHNGKFMIYHGGRVDASLYNPADNTMVAAGAPTNLPLALGAGAHSFAITSGTETGKFLIVRGGGFNQVYMYDPVAHSVSTPAFTLPAVANTGAFAVTITSGTHSGKTLIVLGGNSMNTALYDPATHSMAAGPGLSGSAGAGAHAFSLTSGSEAGNLVFVHGNAVNTSSLYVSSTGLFSAGPGLPATAAAGSSTIPIRTGPQAGKFLTFRGGSNQTFLFDPTAAPFSVAYSLSALTVPGGNIGNGAYAFAIQEVSAGRMPIVRTLVGQDLKILLSWGSQNPRDLDLHMVGTLPSGQTHTNPDDNCDNSLFHVNWRRSAGNWQQQYSAKTRSFIQPDPAYQGQQFFPLNPDTTSALVQDTTTGFGPEMINMIGGYTNGTYWVTVVNWSQWFPAGGSGDTKANQQWDVTDVQLRVYDAEGLAFQMSASQPAVTPTFLAPQPGLVAGCGAGGASDWQQCELWQAFKFTVSGSGPSARVYSPVNTFVNWQDATGTYDYNKCNLSGF
ncbi:MAG: hypothetical protein ACOY5B_07585 [Spirochaetota bacterium]